MSIAKTNTYYDDRSAEDPALKLQLMVKYVKCRSVGGWDEELRFCPSYQPEAAAVKEWQEHRPDQKPERAVNKFFERSRVKAEPSASHDLF